MSGIPIIQQITWSGSDAATSVTKSHSPVWAIRSTTSPATLSIWSSMLRTRRGVNAAETMRRSRAWRGLSVLIMPLKYSTSSGGMSGMLTAPWPDR